MATAALLLLPAGAATAACRIALLLALDVSSSVDAAEDALQRQGLAAALAAPDVRQALLAIPGQPVALSVIEWSGQMQQDLMIDWVMLDSAAAIEAASARIASSQRRYAEFSTGIGQMLRFAHGQFARAPHCDAQVLDVSGDGVHNDGLPPGQAYASGTLQGVTVNALAIVVNDPALDHASPGDLLAHYQSDVIQGPGAFALQADGFEDYQRAMTRKLLRELSFQIGTLARGQPNP